MTIETKKRNPAWTRDEIILALDVYFSVNIHRLSVHEDAIVNLSKILNKLKSYDSQYQTDTYRNPSGVHMKLMNFYSIENPGKGLRHASKLDQKVYDEFNNEKPYLHSIAIKIIEAINSNCEIKSISIDDEAFMEGNIVEKLHKSKERNQKVVTAKKERTFRENGFLKCEICGFDFKDVYGDLGDGFIECHHKKPLSEIDTATKTRINDLILVCSNCHRMLHRKRPWPSVEELQEIVEQQNH